MHESARYGSVSLAADVERFKKRMENVTDPRKLWRSWYYLRKPMVKAALESDVWTRVQSMCADAPREGRSSTGRIIGLAPTLQDGEVSDVLGEGTWKRIGREFIFASDDMELNDALIEKALPVKLAVFFPPLCGGEDTARRDGPTLVVAGILQEEREKVMALLKEVAGEDPGWIAGGDFKEMDGRKGKIAFVCEKLATREKIYRTLRTSRRLGESVEIRRALSEGKFRGYLENLPVGVDAWSLEQLLMDAGVEGIVQVRVLRGTTRALVVFADRDCLQRAQRVTMHARGRAMRWSVPADPSYIFLRSNRSGVALPRRVPESEERANVTRTYPARGANPNRESNEVRRLREELRRSEEEKADIKRQLQAVSEQVSRAVEERLEVVVEKIMSKMVAGGMLASGSCVQGCGLGSRERDEALEKRLKTLEESVRLVMEVVDQFLAKQVSGRKEIGGESDTDLDGNEGSSVGKTGRSSSMRGRGSMSSSSSDSSEAVGAKNGRVEPEDGVMERADSNERVRSPRKERSVCVKTADDLKSFVKEQEKALAETLRVMKDKEVLAFCSQMDIDVPKNRRSGVSLRDHVAGWLAWREGTSCQ